MPDLNPKHLIGKTKLPLSLFPLSAVIVGSLAMLDGMLKYGKDNFRTSPIYASIYVDAALRHLHFWMEGEDNDPESGNNHLGHVLACVAIIIDAWASNRLVDDRKIYGGAREFANKMIPTVAVLQERHKDKTPRHFSIADNKDLVQSTTV